MFRHDFTCSRKFCSEYFLFVSSSQLIEHVWNKIILKFTKCVFRTWNKSHLWAMNDWSCCKCNNRSELFLTRLYRSKISVSFDNMVFSGSFLILSRTFPAKQKKSCYKEKSGHRILDLICLHLQTRPDYFLSNCYFIVKEAYLLSNTVSALSFLFIMILIVESLKR